MSFVARQEASQANDRLTTTVFTYPTTQGPIVQNSEHPVPIAAIVGGVVAGILLAVTITAGWVYWGKSINRKAAKERSETEAFHKTRFNTLRNATLSKPRIETYQPLLSRPAEKMIKFAGDGNGKVGDGKLNEWRSDKSLPSFMNRVEATTPPTAPAVIPKVSKPKPSRRLKGSQRLSSLSLTPKDRLSIISLRESASFAEGIPHKPSTISSASVYSRASEEHQAWALSDPIVAALNLDSLGASVDGAVRSSAAGTEWHSPTSSNHIFLAALDQGVPSSNRHSQASNGSVSRPVVDENGATIGMAY